MNYSILHLENIFRAPLEVLEQQNSDLQIDLEQLDLERMVLNFSKN